MRDLSYGDYLEDWIKQDAIIRNFEIIGEAVANIDDSIKKQYPSTDWKPAKDMRNFLIHEYFEVAYDEVWNTIMINLPVLKQQVIEIITDLNMQN